MPTLAVLVLLTLTPLGRYGGVPTIVALVLFAVPPLLTSTRIWGARGGPAVVEAARGMGMSGGQLFRTVELLLALPLVLTGLRLAAVQVVATATLAAMAGRAVSAGSSPRFHTYDTAQVFAGSPAGRRAGAAGGGALAGVSRALVGHGPKRRRRP